MAVKMILRFLALILCMTFMFLTKKEIENIMWENSKTRLLGLKRANSHFLQVNIRVQLMMIHLPINLKASKRTMMFVLTTAA